jgi:hypothetical protein
MYKSTRRKDGVYTWRKIAGSTALVVRRAPAKRTRSKKKKTVVVRRSRALDSDSDSDSESDSDSDSSEEEIFRVIRNPKIRSRVTLPSRAAILSGSRSTLASRRRRALALLGLDDDDEEDNDEDDGLSTYERQVLLRGAARSGLLPPSRYSTAVALARRRNMMANRRYPGRDADGEIL